MHKILSESLTIEFERFNHALAISDPISLGFSLSIKSSWRNFFGIEEMVLIMCQVGQPNQDRFDPANWAVCRLDALLALLQLPELRPFDLPQALSNARADCDSLVPPAAALLHAALNSKYICFDQPPELLAAFYLPQPFQQLSNWYKDDAAILPFEPNLHRLCQVITHQTSPGSELVLLNRGLLVGAQTIAACQQSHTALVQIIARNIPSAESTNLAENQPGEVWNVLPKLRAAVCAQRERPLVFHLDDAAEMRDFTETRACAQLEQLGAPTPDLFALTGLPTVLARDSEALPDLPAQSIAGTTLLLKPGMGSICAAASYAEAQQSQTAFRAVIKAVTTAVRSPGYQLQESADMQSAVKWEKPALPASLPFSGEVAAVTGSASGIGKAIVKSLLERGSAVTGLDINPAIAATFTHPSYLGLCCDVTDEASVCEALHTVTRRFGGLDMLVLNAGLFPGGCNIEKLTFTEFTKVINVNFIANLAILREAFPMLRLAPRYGRVVIVGSKNMRAPGPGAAAYSTSKAALTQLARVAALEWGSDGIRVNVIHPDAVFDTALYTEEVLRARAAHYGLTVEQYKKRNLLKTEITSHDVAEMVAEMCGPLFRHMTGGQIQLDGGNDRTI